MAKHYIITDDAGIVIRGFSSDFEQPEETAICICVDGGRHFELYGDVNPPLMDEQGRYRYKLVDDVVVERTPEELAGDVSPLPPPDTKALLQAQVQALSDRNEFLEDCIAEMASVVYGDA